MPHFRFRLWQSISWFFFRRRRFFPSFLGLFKSWFIVLSLVGGVKMQDAHFFQGLQWRIPFQRHVDNFLDFFHIKNVGNVNCDFSSYQFCTDNGWYCVTFFLCKNAAKSLGQGVVKCFDSRLKLKICSKISIILWNFVCLWISYLYCVFCFLHIPRQILVLLQMPQVM